MLSRNGWNGRCLQWQVLATAVVVLSCLYSAHPVSGQPVNRLEIPSSPNPVGSGARALGMGGAFIAVADDATAASWNPGGLIQLERPEASVVGEGFLRVEDLEFGASGRSSGQSVSKADLNYLSLAYPFTAFGHNMIVSLNYQHLFDFTRQWEFTLWQEDGPVTTHAEQDGSLYAYGLAYCVQVLPSLSFGFTLNLWEDGLYPNRWEQTNLDVGVIKGGTTVFRTRSFRKDRFSFSGFNGNVGALWSITDKLTLGGVFKSPFTADLKHEFTSIEENRPVVTVERRTSHEELDMPMSYGLGLAYRFSDRLAVSVDIYRTHWNNFEFTDSTGEKISPVSGRPSGKSNVDPTTQLRMGGEYFFIKHPYIIPVRVGAFYDPAPAEGNPDDYYGFSFGSGVAIGKFIFDVAYQYRFGNEVGSSTLRKLNFSEDLMEHTLYSSLIVHF